jgi:adenosylmethionine-8-amino-7-oxononanoate aminotransferase
MSSEKYDRLKILDHRHLWHPFTQMRSWMRDDPVIIERGEGNYLIDVNGRRYLDGVSSLWCNVHGHRKLELDRALTEQAGRIAHSTMLGLSNVAATELGAELIAIAPAGLSRVFYSDSGAESVEVAIRIAAQFFQLTGAPSRTRFLTLAESYHGDTIGAVSLGFSEPFHRHLRGLVFPALKTEPPHIFRFHRQMTPEAATRTALDAAARVIDQHRDTLAALVIEPLMQGAAGMWAHDAEFSRGVAELARAAGALVIADEVATGFGRTGAMFACERAALAPDLMCLGKGITGGYLPLAATLTTEKIFEVFLGEPHEYRAFYYGHTYTGNPLASAVARANLALFRDEKIIERIQPRVAQLTAGLRARFAGLPYVADIRQHGLMAGIELMADPKRRIAFPSARAVGHRIIMRAREAGVIIRPLGDVIILMPPLSIDEAELELLMDTVCAATREILEREPSSELMR